MTETAYTPEPGDFVRWRMSYGYTYGVVLDVHLHGSVLVGARRISDVT